MQSRNREESGAGQEGGGFFLKTLMVSITLETLDAFDDGTELGGLLRLLATACV